uniref:Uncharacterized protein n=1 Tax=Mycena chlorophos TaxID=658473 RepID=A0ABQ0L262_MYCCL|nr:predicted protein [Mycena chlorophos]
MFYQILVKSYLWSFSPLSNCLAITDSDPALSITAFRLLLSLSLTSRRFRYLALPFIFVDLRIGLHPLPAGRNAQNHPVAYFHDVLVVHPQAMLERMRFLTSPAIAPLVRSCTTRCYGVRDMPLVPFLANFFMANLHRFNRLRSLSLWEMTVDRMRFVALLQLTNLVTLSVDNCDLQVDLAMTEAGSRRVNLIP